MDFGVEKLICLLIIDDGLHKAEQITSSLRATGIQVRAENEEDGEEDYTILENMAINIVLFSLDSKNLTLAQAQLLISECGRYVGLVAMTNHFNTEIMVKAIGEGAQDVVSTTNLDPLIQVIKRRAFSLSMLRKAKRMELELMESEKRCQSLLASSKDAVAFIHEGMRIYANEVYLALLATPILTSLRVFPLLIECMLASRTKSKKIYERGGCFNWPITQGRDF